MQDEPDDGREAPALRADADRARVEEWLLVLTAEGFRASMHHEQGRFALRVPEAERRSAERALAQWQAENAGGPRRAPTPLAPIRPPDRWTAGGVSLAMLAFFFVTGPRATRGVWFETGAADSGAILAGELWRTVTALCLHADLGHVASNALFGAIFLAAASARFGPGIATALTLAAGAGGNLANAIFHGPGHHSVGASTAVFGTVGLLAASALATRLRRGDSGARAWVPFAAGLAIIAMIGTGERSDLWAHAFGFATGCFLGLPASLAWPSRFAWPLQVGALAAVAASLLWCWRLALV